MPKSRTVKLYEYDELDEAAKERAREWWSELEREHFDCSDFTERLVEMGKWRYGLDFGKELSWQLHSQGSGVWFDGAMDEAEFMGEVEEWREKKDGPVSEFVARRQKLQAKAKLLRELDVSWSVKCNYGNYRGWSVNVELFDEPDFTDLSLLEDWLEKPVAAGDGELLRTAARNALEYDDDELVGYDSTVYLIFLDWCDENGVPTFRPRTLIGREEAWLKWSKEFTDEMEEYVRDAAHDLYSAAEEEYEYLTSDPEMVGENIEANGYTFTKSGKRCDLGEFDDEDDDE
jgi:hypothetical protein